MRYYKVIENGYITLIGIGDGGIEITKSEYDKILDIIKKTPQSDEYIFKLTEQLCYEKEKITIPESETPENQDIQVL